MKRTKPTIRKFCFHDQNRARVSEIEALTNISNTPCETMIKSMKRDNSREGRKICRWQGDETKKEWLIDGSPVLIIVLRYIYIYIYPRFREYWKWQRAQTYEPFNILDENR